uniref:uncharacterized protein LOC122596171 n=1 Tax=Erigeron canadensis TaxID=72917 RepID=UPI001CB8CDDD|nr:uncharacterized protein LOC122596171 [Erigeron canadensis]
MAQDLKEDGFPDLPVEVSESILSRFDFSEINQLKYLSKQFKSLIKSKPFSEVYNNMAESSASNWLIAHAIFQPKNKVGVLYCIRESDSMTKIIDLGRLLQGRIEPEGEIWLSVQNSLVLLRYFNPPKVFNLFVINIGTNQIHVINVPEIIDGHYLNVDTANFVFEPRATVMNDITYKIVTAEFGEDEILRHFRYTSANGNDQWHVSHARLLEAQESIHPDGGNDDLIRASDLGMLLVSTRLGESIYKCPPTDEFTELTFSLAFSMFTLDDLKRSIVETYFGLDGWAILLVRRTDRGND